MNRKRKYCSLLVLLAFVAGLVPARSIAAKDELIEVYDRDNKPLRTSTVEVSPKAVENSVEKSVIHVRVTLTGSPQADGELLVRQIGGNKLGAFYGRLVPYKAGQTTIDVDCHITPNKDRQGNVVVQAVIASSYKAMQGAVTTELQVTGVTSSAAPKDVSR